MNTSNTLSVCYLREGSLYLTNVSDRFSNRAYIKVGTHSLFSNRKAFIREQCDSFDVTTVFAFIDLEKHCYTVLLKKLRSVLKTRGVDIAQVYLWFQQDDAMSHYAGKVRTWTTFSNKGQDEEVLLSGQLDCQTLHYCLFL